MRVLEWIYYEELENSTADYIPQEGLKDTPFTKRIRNLW